MPAMLFASVLYRAMGQVPPASAYVLRGLNVQLWTINEQPAMPACSSKTPTVLSPTTRGAPRNCSVALSSAHWFSTGCGN